MCKPNDQRLVKKTTRMIRKKRYLLHMTRCTHLVTVLLYVNNEIFTFLVYRYYLVEKFPIFVQMDEALLT